MSFKRLALTVNASIDNFVKKVENHEAIANQVLEEITQNANELRIQIANNTKRLQQLDKQLHTLNDKSQLWQSRAIEKGDSDRDTALKCLEAKHHVDKEKEQLEQQYVACEKLVAELQSHLSEVEQRLNDLQLRKEQLKAKHAKSNALQSASNLNSINATENTFDRWEQSLTTAENAQFNSINVLHGTDAAHLTLDKEFNETENSRVLSNELDQLLNKPSDTQNELQKNGPSNDQTQDPKEV